MSRETELRYWRSDLETRSAGTTRRVGGLGVPYGQWSYLLPGGFVEVVERRALAKTIGDKINVVSRMEHHPEWLLGDVESGTLRLSNEARGLHYEVDLPNTTAGNDCYELVRTGRIRHSSMGFQSFEDEFHRDGSLLVRHLVSIRLTEVSPTAQPAYPDTSTAIRSLASQVGEDPEDVAALAEQGELRALFTRTDLHVTAPPTVEPALVEARSVTPGDLQRRLNENRARQMEANREGRLDLNRRIELNRRRSEAYDLEDRIIASNHNMVSTVSTAETRSV